MIERYQILAERIRQELIGIEKTVDRAERAMRAALQENLEEQDLFWDSAALNLHDFYTGLERIFSQIATRVDENMPEGREWHQDLLNQMGIKISDLRPEILSRETITMLDEYRRFRHVVRNVYAFEFDSQRVQPLVETVRHCFKSLQVELLEFANFLEQIAND